MSPASSEIAVTELPPDSARQIRTVALVGNPNAGKTTLFNALTGLRAKTANFPGTTVTRKTATLDLESGPVLLIDLPGLYSLQPTTPEERVAHDVIESGLDTHPLDAVVMVVDATNLERNLFLVSQVMEREAPALIVLTLWDAAQAEGLKLDPARLARELGCPVVPVIARTGVGLDTLRQALDHLLCEGSLRIPILSPQTACHGCSTCPFQNRYTWTEGVVSRCMTPTRVVRGERTERIDRILAHPVMGLLAFFGVMAGLFFLIFQVASIPMNLIDHLFGAVGSAVKEALPDNDLRSLLVDGVIGGVGGILVFLPQICILFFFLALLEDTGYLARAAFVMDRLMRRIGLPGKAFVPLLSAHACAIPAILATRVIEDRRDRLITILIVPLMTCSARIPVYTMVIALLFPHQPGWAALTFMSAYGLGIVAALVVAFLFKRTVLPGETRPLVLELPNYRRPSLRTAFFHMYDQAGIFVRQAGTLILVISVALWALATYPKSEPPAEAQALFAQAATLATADPAGASHLEQQARHMSDQHALAHSVAGRLGRVFEPVLAPLGFNWQIGIGVITSFAAREVIVSTLAVVYGVGSDQAEDEPRSLLDALRSSTRADGSPVFNVATCLSLLVFYVLAAQCLPTQAATHKETGSWTWALFQLIYMSALAYGASFATYQLAIRLGGG
jgi:ferrous iron transport protein B